MGHGLRGYLRSVQTALGTARPPLLKRHSWPRKPDQRKCCPLVLAKIKTSPPSTHRSCRRGNLHRQMYLSRSLSFASMQTKKTRLTHSSKPDVEEKRYLFENVSVLAAGGISADG